MPTESERLLRIAAVSLLFNLPSTGGGIIHTTELIRFLAQTGYEVCHFFAVYEDWRVGNVTSHLPYPAVAIEFDDAGWNRHNIQQTFRNAVGGFSPDCVIVTDSWNSKGRTPLISVSGSMQKSRSPRPFAKRQLLTHDG